MKKCNRSWGVIPFLGALLIAGCASSPPAPTQAEITDEVSAEATVLAVNKTSREVTLQRADGPNVVVVAGPEIRNFDQIAPGNKLTARFVVNLKARKLTPEEVAAQPTAGVVAARAKLGEAPGAAIGAGVKMTVTIKTVDVEKHIVVFTDPDGTLQTVEAKRDEGKHFISGLKAGDRVELVYGEALILAVK